MAALFQPIQYGPERGFSLLELMATLAVLAVLLGLAVPSMRLFILNQRVRNASFDLSSALQYARSEATKRDGDVTITPAAGGWQNGWTTTNVADGSVLQKHDAFPNLAVTGAPAFVTFQHAGRITAGGGAQFTLDVSPAVSGVTQRCLVIDLSGRVSTDPC
jgi:type IV fimbrial biogenesis protein FimT